MQGPGSPPSARTAMQGRWATARTSPSGPAECASPPTTARPARSGRNRRHGHARTRASTLRKPCAKNDVAPAPRPRHRGSCPGWSGALGDHVDVRDSRDHERRKGEPSARRGACAARRAGAVAPSLPLPAPVSGSGSDGARHRPLGLPGLRSGPNADRAKARPPSDRIRRGPRLFHDHRPARRARSLTSSGSMGMRAPPRAASRNETGASRGRPRRGDAVAWHGGMVRVVEDAGP